MFSNEKGKLRGGNSRRKDREVRKGKSNWRRCEEVTVGGEWGQSLDCIVEMMANR